MKLSLHLSALCRQWTDDVSVFFEPLRRMGLDGVEISLFGADWQALKTRFGLARQMGFDLILGTGIGPETDVSSPDPKVRQAGVDYLKSAVDLAAQAGAMYINGVLTAPWQAFAQGQDPRARMGRSADSLVQVGEYALQAGVGLNCEVINRFETDMLNTLAQGEDFLRRVALPNVKLLADVFHMNIEEDDVAASLKRHAPALGCVHVCENHRGVPGTGHLDWQAILGALKEAGYNGYLSIESFVEAGTPVGDGLNIRISRSTDPLGEMGRGIAFMKKCMEQV